MTMSAKILLIDDDNLVTQTVKNLLERQGYSRITSGSGKTALNLIANDELILSSAIPICSLRTVISHVCS